MVLKLSIRQLNIYVVNLVLLAVVVLSWVYVILAGKFISQRHLDSLDFSDDNGIKEAATSDKLTENSGIKT